MQKYISVLAAISKRGLISFKIISGLLNGKKFAEFIENDIENILIMDNPKFHKCNLGLTYKFLPPYSSQLNPIEESFSELKVIYNNDSVRPSNNDGPNV